MNRVWVYPMTCHCLGYVCVRALNIEHSNAMLRNNRAQYRAHRRQNSKNNLKTSMSKVLTQIYVISYIEGLLMDYI